MQSTENRGFKWIGHVVDHFSRFHVLFALKTKSGKEISKNLKEKVFSYFGLPLIIQSDNGREFVNKIITETIQEWPGMNLKPI